MLISGIFYIAMAYLLGSLSCSILLSKILGLPDPRSAGSGNAGATNILRLSGTRNAIIVLVGDALKGLLPVLIASVSEISGFLLATVALAAVVGHIYPVFFAFKGGKGVATALGTLLALNVTVGIMAILTWILIAALSRYASLASMATGVLAGLYLIIANQVAYFLPIAIMAVLIIWRHWSNVERLMAGTEAKIDFSKFHLTKRG